MKRTALTFMLVHLSLLVSLEEARAEAPRNYVAYVESVAGAVASSQGDLNILDPIADGTRLNLQSSSSEMRICHFVTHELKSLKGPVCALVSSRGVTAEIGTGVTPAGTCAAPVISTIQGGVALRGIPHVIDVSLRPRIKIVNDARRPIRAMMLQDTLTQTVEVLLHAEAVAQPQLSKNQTYLLSIEFADGEKSKMALHADPAAGPAVVIVRIR